MLLSFVIEAQTSQNFCGTNEVHEWLMQANPQYRGEFIDMEFEMRAMVALTSSQRRSGAISTIPVVVQEQLSWREIAFFLMTGFGYLCLMILYLTC